MTDAEVVVIGSGIGGLVAGSLLARYGKSVIVCESHTLPGGAAHGFSRKGFHFDAGPSFFCGLGEGPSLNPLRQVLDALEVSLDTIPYDPLGEYHFPDGTFPVYCDRDRYYEEIAQVTPHGAKEYRELERRLNKLYNGIRQIPTLALRSDWQALPFLLQNYPGALLKLLPIAGLTQKTVGEIMDTCVRNSWVRRTVNLECFLLSGLKSYGTIAPEMAFMYGERHHTKVDYPRGGSGAIVQALITGLEKWGGSLQVRSHVEKILVESGQVTGVRLRNGDILKAPIVISNATVWDTYRKLLSGHHLPPGYRKEALELPRLNSFMHLYLGIRADGLDSLGGHHVVLLDNTLDVNVPGNTCMVSIPSVWDSNLAPPGYHSLHCYTLEPYKSWKLDANYEERKQQRSQSLYRALERIIPDIRDRIEFEMVGTPITHERFLRRYQGTYGPGIPPIQGIFPLNHTPLPGLYRVGDTTMPGIGVPAVAASGILCANSLVSPQQTLQLLKQVGLA
ncbi:phytoene desaturase family protein [Sodalinema gerasimenkoae]|uniref:phytoene desaturase family protein n=1 Tax=Sodalinema gerasimenkoae TaxID=2862348 RepID=UPI0013580DAC|nr:NAD(P)/FAD-dependent oxidoreductase [Sodalinema gerasimenkoae]